MQAKGQALDKIEGQSLRILSKGINPSFSPQTLNCHMNEESDPLPTTITLLLLQQHSPPFV